MPPGQFAACMCAADYDLTGQILWPAASMLAGYLAANPALLENCTCACELGAGLGLVGLLAAQACPVVLTDHNDVVLRVLGRNAELNQAHHSIRSASVSLMRNAPASNLTVLCPM